MDLDYQIIGDFESVKGSKWKPEEDKLALAVQKFFIRSARERMSDPSPVPTFYATLTEDVELPEKSYKKGTRLKAVFASRMGDIGFTSDLEKGQTYGIRIDPYGDSLTDISLEK